MGKMWGFGKTMVTNTDIRRYSFGCDIWGQFWGPFWTHFETIIGQIPDPTMSRPPKSMISGCLTSKYLPIIFHARAWYRFLWHKSSTSTLNLTSQTMKIPHFDPIWPYFDLILDLILDPIFGPLIWTYFRTPFQTSFWSSIYMVNGQNVGI